ncbi:hypothetical protein GCM10009677_08610 [Sphaerisporangium rubeum]
MADPLAGPHHPIGAGLSGPRRLSGRRTAGAQRAATGTGHGAARLPCLFPAVPHQERMDGTPPLARPTLPPSTLDFRVVDLPGPVCRIGLQSYPTDRRDVRS